MQRIVIKPRAKADLKNIWRYSFNNWGIKKADRYMADLADAINSLASNPTIGISIDHVHPKYRQYSVNHHLVIYRLTLKEINIIRVLNEEMQIDQHLH